MENKFIGLRDPHLNVFYTYGDKAHLENNITKALINVLDYSSDGELQTLIENLFGFVLPKGRYRFNYYLQRKPEEELVKKYPNRLIFAFSPTGKHWGIEGIDTKDIKLLKEELKKQADEDFYFEDETESFINNTLESILKIREDKGSIPDAWMFVDVDDKPTLVVAMENKLGNLDPYQIRNHVEKSLFITDKLEPIYKRYYEIIDEFKSINSYMTNQFIEYMIILGYANVNDFVLACRANEKLRARLAQNFGARILDMSCKGIIDERGTDMVRCHVNYPYLSEINLRFSKDNMELWLSFGAKQSGARKMLSQIDYHDFDDKAFHSRQGFHLQRGGGPGAPNIKDSYILESWPLEKYINYWKANVDFVKTSSIDEAISLIDTLYKQGDVNKEDVEKIVNRLNRYNREKSKIFVVPEISLVSSWPYDEAAELGLEGFAKEIKTKVDLALTQMKLH